MGQITKGQYAEYLEGLKSTLIPGTRQFKELGLTIKQLKDDIGSDLQHNLPTSLALPTLYEVRRLNQMQGSSASTFRAKVSISFSHSSFFLPSSIRCLSSCPNAYHFCLISCTICFARSSLIAPCVPLTSI